MILVCILGPSFSGKLGKNGQWDVLDFVTVQISELKEKHIYNQKLFHCIIVRQWDRGQPKDSICIIIIILGRCCNSVYRGLKGPWHPSMESPNQPGLSRWFHTKPFCTQQDVLLISCLFCYRIQVMLTWAQLRLQDVSFAPWYTMFFSHWWENLKNVIVRFLIEIWLKENWFLSVSYNLQLF